MANTVSVPQLCWYGNSELELEFPPSWEVNTCHMRGHARPPLSKKEIGSAFARPIGTSPIRELAAGRKEVVILFDDMTRPTRVAELLPFVLEELEAAAVPDEGIRFIAAIGAHGALTRLDFSKKLGEAVLDRFPVYNHNPYENCTFLGKTSQGTPISINSEVMNCDLKIGIGCILPHPLTGFGGGGKIILPGVASIDTIAENHGALPTRTLSQGRDPAMGMGNYDKNVLHLDFAEAASMAGLDIKIDAIVNIRGETTALFIGEPATAHEEGVALAREIYATEVAAGNDIAVLNTYAKANEAMLAMPQATSLLREDGGDVVLIVNAPEGQVPHYLLRSFGKKLGGRLWSASTSLPPRVRRLIILTSYIDRAGVDWIGPPDSITWAKTWPHVVAELRATYGDHARVAVVPDATIQYFPQGKENQS
ncbi:MAG: DUF2088 domain-containing protein [Chloroflexi bacterium]|nr:DUF2088 domain-containing protein [Chloroflexota bacterium]